MNPWLRKLLSRLVDQSGQVSSDSGPSEPAPSSPSPGTGPADSAPSTGAEAPQQDSFYDVSKLPEELKPHWRSMHRAYTQKLEGIRDLQTKAAQIQQFYDDPNFAREVITKWVGQFGYQLTPAQAQAAAQQATSGAGQRSANPQLVEAVKSNLDPALHWMAPSLANALEAANQQFVGPLYQQQQEQQLGQRSAEYDDLAEDLSSVAPGWEQHEDTMSELVDFMSGPDLYHPVFGSKLHILYNTIASNAAATAAAVNRMKGAARARSGISRGAANTASNLQDRIKKAPNMRQAWDLAIQNALQKP